MRLWDSGNLPPAKWPAHVRHREKTRSEFVDSVGVRDAAAAPASSEMQASAADEGRGWSVRHHHHGRFKTSRQKVIYNLPVGMEMVTSAISVGALLGIGTRPHTDTSMKHTDIQMICQTPGSMVDTSLTAGHYTAKSEDRLIHVEWRGTPELVGATRRWRHKQFNPLFEFCFSVGENP